MLARFWASLRGVIATCRSGFLRLSLATAVVGLLACHTSLPVENQGARQYATAETSGAIRGTGDSRALTHALQAAAREAGIELRGDGRLAQLARRFSAERAPTSEALATAARELGLVDAAPVFVTVVAEPELLAASLLGSLATPLGELRPTHYGAFVHAAAGAVSIVLSYRPIELDAVPRRLPTPATLRLHGRLAAGLGDVKLDVSGPQQRFALPLGATSEFDVRIALHESGAYRLRMLAPASSHTQLLAELVVQVGEERPHANGRSVPTHRRQAGEIAQALLARLTALRSEHGQPALAVDARLLAGAARDASALGAGTVPSPTSAAQAPGLSFTRTARGANIAALFSELSGDAQQRTVMLNEALTHVGVAVVAVGEQWQAVLKLAALAAPLDTTLAAARLLTSLNEHRRARGASALRPDADLSRAARQAVEAFRAQPGVSERELATLANAKLAGYALAYRQVSALAAFVRDPSEAASLEPALDPEASTVGVAVLQVAGGEVAAPDVVVIIALGWPR